MNPNLKKIETCQTECFDFRRNVSKADAQFFDFRRNLPKTDASVYHSKKVNIEMMYSLFEPSGRTKNFLSGDIKKVVGNLV